MRVGPPRGEGGWAGGAAGSNIPMAVFLSCRVTPGRAPRARQRPTRGAIRPTPAPPIRAVDQNHLGPSGGSGADPAAAAAAASCGVSPVAYPEKAAL